MTTTDSSLKSSIRTVFDEVCRDFGDLPGEPAVHVGKLMGALRSVRQGVGRAEWTAACDAVVPGHALTRIIHSEPITWQSYHKPRGYSGDAALLDLIHGSVRPDGEGLARGLYETIYHTAECTAVRERSGIIAGYVDRLARKRPPRVLCLCSGHLWEAGISAAVADGAVEEYVAVDHDSHSVEQVSGLYGRLGVTARRARLLALVSGKEDVPGDFDMIYSAGVYDYLKRGMAERLTKWMYARLRPGGMVLTPNFSPTVPSVGYMEAFMRWRLIYRDANQMRDLVARACGLPASSVKTFTGENGAIVYAEARRPEL